RHGLTVDEADHYGLLLPIPREPHALQRVKITRRTIISPYPCTTLVPPKRLDRFEVAGARGYEAQVAERGEEDEIAMAEPHVARLQSALAINWVPVHWEWNSDNKHWIVGWIHVDAFERLRVPHPLDEYRVLRSTLLCVGPGSTSCSQLAEGTVMRKYDCIGAL